MSVSPNAWTLFARRDDLELRMTADVRERLAEQGVSIAEGESAAAA